MELYSQFEELWDKLESVFLTGKMNEKEWTKAFEMAKEIQENASDGENQVFFFFDEYMDALEFCKSYETLLKVIEEVADLYKDYPMVLNDTRARKCFLLSEIGRHEEAIQYVEAWYLEDPKNLHMAGCYVHVLTEAKQYEKAEELTHQYASELSACTEFNEVLFNETCILYEKMGKTKEHKAMKNAIKEYEERLEEELMLSLEDFDPDLMW